MEKKGHAQAAKRPPIWDCNSSLYDSFELKSFERQLDSTIASRTYSMPHVSDPARRPTQTQLQKKPSKLSRSIHRLLRSVFRVKPASDERSHGYGHLGEGYYGLYPHYGALATIPEACEKDALSSPELSSMLGKSVSERFPGAAVAAARISCP